MGVSLKENHVKNEIAQKSNGNLNKYRIIAAILFFTFSVLAVLFDLNVIKLASVLANFNISNLEILEKIDWGAVASISALFVLISVLKLDKKVTSIYEKFKNYEGNVKYLIILLFLIVGFIGLWFAIRSFGTIVKNLLILQTEIIRDENEVAKEVLVGKDYTTSQIFLMLGYILTANLCFNLAKTFESLVQNSSFEESAPRLLEALIQATIIGLIIFIPRYSDSALLDQLSGNNRVFGSILYVVILITLIAVLLLLIWFRKREFPKVE